MATISNFGDVWKSKGDVTEIFAGDQNKLDSRLSEKRLIHQRAVPLVDLTSANDTALI